jgi:hypothetical protein
MWMYNQAGQRTISRALKYIEEWDDTCCVILLCNDLRSICCLKGRRGRRGVGWWGGTEGLIGCYQPK